MIKKPSQPQLKKDVQTLEITDFGGRLTRTKNGKLNSGFAKFSSSFGYDPFTKPNQLTWFEAPVDITQGVVTDMILSSKNRFELNQSVVYGVGSHGVLYRIQPNSVANPDLDAVSSVLALTTGSPTYNYGSGIEFYGSRAYFTSDNKISYKTNSVPLDSTGENNLGNSSIISAVYRPTAQFLGKLYLGNKTNIICIDSTNSITSYSVLSPGLPDESYITDLEVSPDGNYLYITAMKMSNEDLSTVSADRQSASVADSTIYKWNGIDLGITAVTNIPSVGVTALKVYLNKSVFFSNDIFGTALNDGENKLLTLPNNKSPWANGVITTGNFICWIAPELNSAGTMISASLYYYGAQDGQAHKGLWRVMKYTSSLSNGFIYQSPWLEIVNNKYSTVNNGITAPVPLGYGKHYFSTYEINSGHSATDKYTLQRFLMTSSGTGTPQLGVYETQNELFSKRVSLAAIRVYTEPTVAGNGFQIDIIGSDGNVVTNGTFNYTYSAGTDITLLQGSLERINFNPNMKNLYSYGVRITNTGTTNMVINKIEIDWSYSGK